MKTDTNLIILKIMIYAFTVNNKEKGAFGMKDPVGLT